MAVDWKQALTKKIGPLPAWGWGAVAGGGYLVYRVMSGRGISLTGSDSTQAATGEGTTGASGYGSGTAAYDEYNPPANADISALTAALVAESTLVGQTQAQLTASQAYALKMKQRGTNWANWGKHWKKVAQRASGNAKKSANKKPKTKHKGTTTGGLKNWAGGTPFFDERGRAKPKTPQHKIAQHAAPQRVRDRAPIVHKSPARPKRNGGTPGGPMLKARVQTRPAGHSPNTRKR